MEHKRMVIGVDFSEASAAAARWAVQQFARDADAILVHVIDDRLPEPLDADTATKRGVALQAELGGAPSVEIVPGDTAVALGTLAAERGAGLIVVGKHGAGGGHKALGSIAEHLILYSPVPLLLATGMGEHEPRNILAALHDDLSRQRVLQWARSLSVEFDAACVALCIADDIVRTHLLSMASLAARGGGVASRELDGDEDDCAPWLAELTDMQPLLEGHTPAHAATTARHVVENAERLHSDLIVVGSSGFAAATASPELSVACSIARQAACPVLVAKSEARAPWGGV
jgi:nucleotide-binding universal stress UspA family protein